MTSLFHHWWNLRNAARAVFWRGSAQPRDVRPVLEELREFCRADTSAIGVAQNGQVDIHQTMILQGRREVWLKLQQLLNLSDEVLLKMKEQEDDDGPQET